MKRIACGLVALLLFANGRAGACSMIGEWVKPTNFELVQLADAIAVATAVQATKGSDPFDSAVVFRIDRVLKGTPPPTVSTAGWFGKPGPSPAAGLLSQPHPEAFAGGCNRYTFKRGGQYVLFLSRREDGTWLQTGYSFSRINEDYRGEQDPWVGTIKSYLKVQSSSAPMDQLRALEGMLRAGTDLDGRVLSPSEKDDIRDHLRSLSPYKPTDYLIDAYRQLESGRAPANGIRDHAADREKSEAEELSRLVFGGDDGTWTSADKKQFILRSLVNGEHPDAMPFFRKLQSGSSDPGTVGLTLRFLAANGAYSEAYQWVSTKLMATLPRLPKKEQQVLVSDIAKVQAGKDSDHPRWQSDARAAAEWPELSLRLYTWEVDHWGRDHALYFDAIDKIPVASYRDRPELTLALAGQYNEGVRKWAAGELTRAGFPGESDAERVRLPLLAILTAWTAEDTHFVEDKVFCRGGETRLALIRLAGESADDLYGGVLLRISASPLSAAERTAVRQAFAKWKARLGEEPTPLYANQGQLPKPIRCD